MNAARLHDQLRETAEVWTNNCARCFAEKRPFHHPKRDCPEFTRDLVESYRRVKMKNDLGKPQCWSCFMPLDMCAKFFDDETRTVRNTRANVACSYPHVVLDTWACMWEYCEKARQIWLKRIQELKGLDGDDEKQFKEYFREMIAVPGGKPISRVAFDVNWLTHEFFIGNEPRWETIY